jgi:hypothetical protein
MLKLNKCLTELKKIGCVAVKTSFEDEGALFNDLIRLRYLTSQENLKLFIKIGGCEANTDINMAENLCCDGIIVPMVESHYSIKKFLDSIKKYNLFEKVIGINLETKLANELTFDNYILDKINTLTIGRVDLISSLGKDRKEINSEEMYRIVTDTFLKIRNSKEHIKLYLGGSINEASYGFIKKLYDNNLLDFVETRFIVFKVEKLLENYIECIKKANKFEYLWLKHLNEIKQKNVKINEDRINLIKTRM